MSLQATPLVKQLINLKSNVESGTSDRTDVERIAVRLGSSKLGQRLRTYLYTEDTQFLDVSHSEAFKAVVYRQTHVTNAPLRVNGTIEASPVPGTTELPVIYSRDTLFQDILTLYWQDEPLEHFEFEEGRQERVLHTPLTLTWNDREYNLLCEAVNKSFYWPKDLKVPSTLEPWLTLRPQDRTTLATGLKRQGYIMDSFVGIGLLPEHVHTDSIWDLGVCVLSNERITKLSEELGLSMDATQITLWFDEGSYFKGTCVSQTLSGLVPGFYGGIKRPSGSTGAATCVSGSVMDSFQYVPWQATLNRQQCDYAERELPVRAKLPGADTFIKAATGFPAYIQQLNDQLVSSTARIFRKCDVKGYAGKVAIGVSNEPVQFIIRGPKLKPRIQTMAFLFSPALPIHTDIMKVRVEFIQDSSLDMNLIQLNVADSNHDWISKWYIAWAGRDTDGDGIVLSSDPVVLDSSVRWNRIKWFDTTQYKSTADINMDSASTAIRVATERIRHFSGKVGIYDKIARRIIREDPELMTWEIRVLLTEAIQRSISATKKNSGSDRFEGYGWIMEHLPDNCQNWLFDNIHDSIDNVGTLVKSTLNARSKSTPAEYDTTYTEMLHGMNQVSEVMPAHYVAATETLELLQEFPTDQYHKIKARGRVLWAKYQADTSTDVIRDVLQFIAKSKQLWRSVYSNDSTVNPGFSYENAAVVISTWAQELSTRVNTKLLIGAMVTEFSLNLLSHVLGVDDLEYAGFIDGIFLPVATERSIQLGMVGTKGTFASLLAHPVYLSALTDTCKYKIKEVYPLTSANWILRTSQRIKQSSYMIKLVEVV